MTDFHDKYDETHVVTCRDCVTTLRDESIEIVMSDYRALGHTPVRRFIEAAWDRDHPEYMEALHG